MGPVGAGNTVKAINNMCASVNSCAMMEGLALGVKAGLDRARASGTRSGRPIGRPRRQFDVERARAMRAEGRSWRYIAQALKVPRRTVERLANP